jgi:hypothetical protein
MTTGLLQLRCARCRYGASCRTMPDRCPMCGGSMWEAEEPRDVAEFLADLDRPLGREPAERLNDR